MPVELDDIPCTDPDVQRREARKARYRLIRVERNAKVKDIADELGVTRQTWTTWEQHGVEPSEALIERLHRLTGRDYVWLRGD